MRVEDSRTPMSEARQGARVKRLARERVGSTYLHSFRVGLLVHSTNSQDNFLRREFAVVIVAFLPRKGPVPSPARRTTALVMSSR